MISNQIVISLKYIIAFIVLTHLFACEQVTFREAQPTQINNLSEFPKRVQGQYLSLDGNLTLKITDHAIFAIYDLDNKFHINQLDSNERLSGDTLINLRTNKKAIVKITGDTLVKHIHETDTVFNINETNILKKFKGYYFINTWYGDDSWEVKKMQLSKGKLILSKISTKEDIEQFKAITESPQDTIPYKLAITKKQFNKFVKNKGFRNNETFVRQK
ncbi:MAG: hypothetical protein WBP45_09570 [Daejeonella sp.]